MNYMNTKSLISSFIEYNSTGEKEIIFLQHSSEFLSHIISTTIKLSAKIAYLEETHNTYLS